MVMRFLGFGLAMGLLAARGAFSVPGELGVSLLPKQLETGQVALLRVMLPAAETETATDLKCRMDDHDIALSDCPKETVKAKCGFLPVSVDATVGTHEVTLTWLQAGIEKKQTVKYDVAKGHYPINRLKVNPDIAKPSEKDQLRIARESEELKAIYAVSNSVPLWRGTFQLPVETKVTSRFGSQRLFNGEVKSIHFGVDLRAGRGKAIQSANAGKVVVAKELFLGGNTVVIDHGAQIFTSYGHLSALDVKVGDSVDKGVRIGKAGATGRATGPHLHWGVKVNGVAVDPEQMRKVFNRMFDETSAKLQGRKADPHRKTR